MAKKKSEKEPKPEPKPKPPKEERVTFSALKERGWTVATVKKFSPEPDATAVNPVYRTAAPVKLYALQRIEQIESTPEFQEWTAANQKRREAGAKRAATNAAIKEQERRKYLALLRTKEAQMRKYIDSLHIEVAIMELEEVYRLADNHYEDRQKQLMQQAFRRGEIYEGGCGDFSDPDKKCLFQERIAVNYLRHVHTPYDRVVKRVAGRMGEEVAMECLSQKVFDAISAAYPDLREECDRQLKGRRENAAAIKALLENGIQ